MATVCPVWYQLGFCKYFLCSNVQGCCATRWLPLANLLLRGKAFFLRLSQGGEALHSRVSVLCPSVDTGSGEYGPAAAGSSQGQVGCQE